jgi:cell division protease FtsH
LGKVSFDGERQPLFLRTNQASSNGDYSESTAQEIDAEVRRIIEEQYTRVTTLLTTQQKTLRDAAAVLLQKEVITGDELKAIALEVGTTARVAAAAAVH